MDKTATSRDVITYGLESSGRLVAMFCDDLTNEQLLHRPCDGSNCAAWLLGHMTLANRGGLKSLGKIDDAPELPMPVEEFENRFKRADDAPAAEEFGDTSKLLQAFNESMAAYVKAVREASDDVLDAEAGGPSTPFSNVREMAAFFVIHTATHAGHLSTIRRSLGKPPLI